MPLKNTQSKVLPSEAYKTAMTSASAAVSQHTEIPTEGDIPQTSTAWCTPVLIPVYAGIRLP